MNSLPDLTSNLRIDQPNSDVSPEIDDANADLVVNTNRGSLKVHKSVLKCCPYFAAMIEGNWSETHSSIINFDLYSYETTRFTIEHLYQSKPHIDSNQNLKELLALSDMLGIESLVQLVCSTMVVKLCHNFHKPCKTCIDGVISSFQISSTYYVIDMQEKCLQWLTRHFTKTWNTKSFANLPDFLQEKCLEALKSSVTVENIIDISLSCTQLKELLPSVKWTEPVNDLLDRLSLSCMEFLQHNFKDVIQSTRFESLKQGDSWDLTRVETIFLEAIQNLPVDQACLAYIALEEIIQKPVEINGEYQPDPAFTIFINVLHKKVESRLIQRVGMATKCAAWSSLPQVKQTTIMQLGFFDPIDKTSHIKKPAAKPVVRNNLSTSKSLNQTHSNDPTPNSSVTRLPPRIDPGRRSLLPGRSTLRSNSFRPTISSSQATEQADSERPSLSENRRFHTSNRGIPSSLIRSQSGRASYVTRNVATPSTATSTSRPATSQVNTSTRSTNSVRGHRISSTR